MISPWRVRAIATTSTLGFVVACGGELRIDDGRASLDSGAPFDDAVVDGAADAPEVTSEIAIDAIDDVGDDADAQEIGKPCQRDVDCKLASLHCDALAGCVPCVVDADCPTKERKRCDGSLHRCVECGVSGDCAVGFTCELETRKCIPICGGTPCPAPTPKCDTGREVCVACFTDSNCPRYCEIPSGRCLDCLVDESCPADHPRCDTIVGKCVVCLTSSDCPAGKPLCDPVGETCTAG